MKTLTFTQAKDIINFCNDNDCVREIQQEYSRLYGYGHYFSHYDGNTLEDILHLGYYCFKC
jgi:hypothetical protein